tara:strand:- start:704 stop:1072 length:369 start_codon:yes stop_codon:yes gene_type:complete
MMGATGHVDPELWRLAGMSACSNDEVRFLLDDIICRFVPVGSPGIAVPTPVASMLAIYSMARLFHYGRLTGPTPAALSYDEMTNMRVPPDASLIFSILNTSPRDSPQDCLGEQDYPVPQDDP